MGLPKDISASPEEINADDLGHGENFSTGLLAEVDHCKIKNFSVKDLVHLSAVENRLEKVNVSDKDVISEILPSIADGHLEKKDASDKDRISLKKTLQIPEVAQRLKNARGKYHSKKEKNNLKVKRQHKNIISDILLYTTGDHLEQEDASDKNIISDIRPSIAGDHLEKKDASDKNIISDIPSSMGGDHLEKKDASDKNIISDIRPFIAGDHLEKEDASDKNIISDIPSSMAGDHLEKEDASDKNIISDIRPFIAGDHLEKEDASDKNIISDIRPFIAGDHLEKEDASDKNIISDIPPSMAGDHLEKKDASDKNIISDIPPSMAGDHREKKDASDKNIISDIPRFMADVHLEKEVASDKNISQIPPSTAGDRLEKEDASDKDVISYIPLKSIRIPKVARRLSVKNAKRKYDSQKEKTNLKVKRQRKHLLKDLPSDVDFLSREWHRSSRSTYNEDTEEEKFDSGSNFSPAPTGPHDCCICQRSYVHEKSLKRHIKTHLKSEAFQCQTCDATFYQATDLQKHKRTHDGRRPYSCDKCSASFTQLSALNRHQKIHIDDKGFSCDECGMRFIQSSSLKRHQNSHKSTKTFTCNFCKTMFSEKQHLESHVNSLHGDLSNQERKEFTCEICNKVFFRYSNYWTHKKGHDKDTKNAYKCEKCDKTFSTKSNMTRHCNFQHEKMPSSVIEKPYLCTVCGEQFSRNVSLKLHMRFHDTQEVHCCNICAKTFTAKNWLRKHMTLHKNGGFQCKQCLQIFRSHFRFSLHKKSMGDNCQIIKQAKIACRKYACKYCDAKLSLRPRLAKHIRKAHPEVQAFICDVCDKGFCYYLDLISHRKIHRYIPYQCKICHIAFHRYVQLVEHYLDEMHILKISAKPQPSEDQSSVAKLPAETNVTDNSPQQIIESDLTKNPVMAAACSEMQLESSMRTDIAASKDTSNSASLNCHVCNLVFLTAVHYRAHGRLVHNKKRYPCQKCDSGFDSLNKFQIHMKTIHPIPKEKSLNKNRLKKKNKSYKILNLKVAPKLDPVKLDKLLKARVKEAMKKSKFKLSNSGKTKTNKNRPKSFIID